MGRWKDRWIPSSFFRLFNSSVLFSGIKTSSSNHFFKWQRKVKNKQKKTSINKERSYLAFSFTRQLNDLSIWNDFSKWWVSRATFYFQTIEDNSGKLLFLHDISKLPRHHEIGIWVTRVLGNGSFISLIKFSNSLVKCSVIGHLLNVVSVRESVALDTMSAEITLQMPFSKCNADSFSQWLSLFE